jgi:hypothetical protein
MGTCLQAAFFAYSCKHWGHVKMSFLPKKNIKNFTKETLKNGFSVPYICKDINPHCYLKSE